MLRKSPLDISFFFHLTLYSTIFESHFVSVKLPRLYDVIETFEKIRASWSSIPSIVSEVRGKGHNFNRFVIGIYANDQHMFHNKAKKCKMFEFLELLAFSQIN